MAIPGDLTITPDVPSAFSEQVISAFQMRGHDTFSLGLSGGGTARRCYERLAETAGGRIDWWKVDVYWSDERCVPHDHEDSNYRLAREALLDRVGAANATHLMRCAEGADPYQLRLGDLGRVDLIHLGMGADGHTASLFPGSDALDADPGRLVVTTEDPTGLNPYQRMTLTLGGIARANLVLVTVEGEEKADALAAVAAGEDLPASRISADHVIWLVDEAAASRL
ncbi:MAG: 6-phosphogluconolactonase [Acidimicrobiales bacterium]|nr:6-phosphogluconolactonase [Acidimicrobiales bacterium]